ncbi:MAG: sulfatase-like hydrolase/transferase [Tenuifilaceae bacterium]
MNLNFRPDFLKSVHLGFIAVGGLMLNSNTQAQTQKKPNLLFIITDQQRFDALSIAGNRILQTPNLDRLAKQGVWFKNAYTQCAVSGPARATILTGCTVENHGILNNGLADSGTPQSSTVMPQKTFDQILTDSAGYHCEYYGKWHCPQFAASCYKNPVKYSTSGRYIFASSGDVRFYKDNYLNQVFPKPALKAGELYDTFSERPYIPNVLDKRYGMTQTQVDNSGISYAQPDLHGTISIPDEHSLTAFRAKQTIEALERLKDTTFSITCSFHFPHAPMLASKFYSDMFPVNDMPVPVSISDPMTNSPYYNSNSRTKHPEYADPNKIKFMISEYYALVKEIDDWVGEILVKLDELGLAENTLVIFTSDHGEMLGAHGMREKNVFLEESAHIPMMIRFPGHINPETAVNEYVSNIDLFATILDYCDVSAPASDGESLRGLIDGTDQTHAKYIVTEWLSSTDKVPGYMILKDSWKMFIPYSATSTTIDALYNLKDDPYEMNNLLGSNPNEQQYTTKVNELHTDLVNWLIEHKSRHYDGVRTRNLTGTLLTTGNINNPQYQFRIFPNPASSQVMVDSNNLRIDSVDVLDLSGRTIFTDNKSFAGIKTLDLNLKPGIYLVHLNSEYQFQAQKIIIE